MRSKVGTGYILQNKCHAIFIFDYFAIFNSYFVVAFPLLTGPAKRKIEITTVNASIQVAKLNIGFYPYRHSFELLPIAHLDKF